MLFGRPHAISNLISLSQAQKNRATALYNVLKWPPNHQDMPESHETFHQSAFSYHIEVKTMNIFGSWFEMMALKTHVSSIWPIHGGKAPSCIKSNPGTARSSSRNFAMAHHPPSNTTWRHLIYFSCVRYLLNRPKPPPMVWSTGTENLVIDLHETYRRYETTTNWQNPAKLFIDGPLCIISDQE